jgi:Flp pilus assembly pilin Flp
VSRPWHPGERGAAPAEFALTAGLIAVLFLAALQLGYGLHVRNTAIAHVIEGARHGARADSSPEQGAARARELLGTTLPGRYGTSVSAQHAVIDGVLVVEVTAEVPLPLVGPLGPPGSMTVTGHAFAEDQP